MKTLNLAFLAVGISALPAGAQVFSFSIDIKTQKSSADAAFERRLFSDGFGQATDVFAPVGSTWWVVADTAGNGINPAPNASGQIARDLILGPDDVLVQAGATPGGAAGSITGRLLTNIQNVSGDLRGKNFYFFLFDAPGGAVDPRPVGTPAFDSESGVPFFSQFGTVSLGIANPPDFGSAVMPILQNVYADQFTVVPEPAAVGTLAGVGLLAGAWLRRRAARNR